QLEPYFTAYRNDFDTAQVAWIECADQANALRIHGEILSGELDFFSASQKQFLAAPTKQHSLFATLRRRDAAQELGEELTAMIFAASPGEVVGPMRIASGYVVTRVLAHTPAVLNEATRTVIEEILFDDWLAERRRTARVTWHWGTANRTLQAA